MLILIILESRNACGPTTYNLSNDLTHSWTPESEGNFDQIFLKKLSWSQFLLAPTLKIYFFLTSILDFSSAYLIYKQKLNPPANIFQAFFLQLALEIARMLQ